MSIKQVVERLDDAVYFLSQGDLGGVSDRVGCIYTGEFECSVHTLKYIISMLSKNGFEREWTNRMVMQLKLNETGLVLEHNRHCIDFGEAPPCALDLEDILKNRLLGNR